MLKGITRLRAEGKRGQELSPFQLAELGNENFGRGIR